jgi:hypothetical protein
MTENGHFSDRQVSVSRVDVAAAHEAWRLGILACLDGAPRARDNHGRKCNIGCGHVFGLFDAGVSRWP